MPEAPLKARFADAAKALFGGDYGRSGRSMLGVGEIDASEIRDLSLL